MVLGAGGAREHGVCAAVRNDAFCDCTGRPLAMRPECCRPTSEHCSSMQAPQPSSGCREAVAASGKDGPTAAALQ